MENANGNTPVVVECRDAMELLTVVSLRGERFEGGGRGSWAFRGHVNSAWGLMPSAFRSEEKLVRGMYTSHEKPWTHWSNRDQIQAEAQTLREFVREADAAGSSIPLDSPELRDALLAPFKARYIPSPGSEKQIWPPRIALPLIALAQHHGLGTRCLDWSRSPNVAAYFAAVDAARAENAPEYFCIWAFSLALDNLWKGLEGPFGGLPKRVAYVVEAPYANNPNHRAQEGVFVTVPITNESLEAPAERLDFVEQLRQVKAYPTSAIILYKFVAPRSVAPEVLWQLAKENVTAARLFPGYQGAAAGVLESKLCRPIVRQ